MKKESIKRIKIYWYSTYSVIIPVILSVMLFVADIKQKIDIMRICDNEMLSEMLTAVITCISIIISIFGFLIPSLISAKNDTMVKYFIENADIEAFIGKIKSVVLSGFLGILLSVLLYLSSDLSYYILKILIFSWIAVGFNFACNAYRFIGIIISLLLTEKKHNEKVCINELSEEKVEQINNKIQRL